MNEIDVWRNLPIVASAIPQTLFALIYSLPMLGAGEWWRTFVGRALFFKSLTLAALVDFVTLAIVTRAVRGATWNWSVTEYTIEDRVVITGYWAVLATIIYQLWALIQERRRSHNY